MGGHDRPWKVLFDLCLRAAEVVSPYMATAYSHLYLPEKSPLKEGAFSRGAYKNVCALYLVFSQRPDLFIEKPVAVAVIIQPPDHIPFEPGVGVTLRVELDYLHPVGGHGGNK